MKRKQIIIALLLIAVLIAAVAALGQCSRDEGLPAGGTTEMPGYMDDTLAETDEPGTLSGENGTSADQTEEGREDGDESTGSDPTQSGEEPSDDADSSTEETDPAETTASAGEDGSAGATEDSGTDGSAATSTTAAAPEDITGRLQFTQYGRYTGLFTEDGTDEYVENVAILLVTNISEVYLQYATVTFDISGAPAVFTVTGLNPGESAWVMEKNRLAIELDAVFTHVDDIASFARDNRESSEDVTVILGDGTITVENGTGNDLKGLYIYYKQRHTDGNFLGGITYRIPMGDLAAGETASAIAAHCNPATCEVVRIDWESEGN